jgi:hypothetical protein
MSQSLPSAKRLTSLKSSDDAHARTTHNEIAWPKRKPLHLAKFILVYKIANIVELVVDRMLLLINGKSRRLEARFFQTASERAAYKIAYIS